MGTSEIKTIYFKEYEYFCDVYYMCEELGYSVNGVLHSEKVFRVSSFDNYSKKWIGKLCFSHEYYSQLNRFKSCKSECSKFEVEKHIIKSELSK